MSKKRRSFLDEKARAVAAKVIEELTAEGMPNVRVSVILADTDRIKEGRGELGGARALRNPP